ncbi:MAG TPA: CDP-alcohol phosphatidyltransferase family protein [Candidatus Omnitrophota bacterium]|nr:CDP-alcohol phosphatidyltransferase family protein [Candidatus Omnitrophota bacterium]
MTKARLRDLIYQPVKAVVNEIGVGLDRYNVTPHQLTMTGFLVNILGCILYAHGHFSSGSLVILFAGIFDMLDGSLARSSNKTSKFGAFIDSVIDRYSDFLIFGGLTVHFAKANQADYVLLTLAVIAGSFLTSYTKARAESLIRHCDVGMIERPERILIICIGGLFGAIVPALWILAFATHFTALDRIYYTWKRTEGNLSERDED